MIVSAGGVSVITTVVTLIVRGPGIVVVLVMVFVMHGTEVVQVEVVGTTTPLKAATNGAVECAW